MADGDREVVGGGGATDDAAVLAVLRAVLKHARVDGNGRDDDLGAVRRFAERVQRVENVFTVLREVLERSVAYGSSWEFTCDGRDFDPERAHRLLTGLLDVRPRPPG